MDNNEDLNQVNEEETLYDEMNIPEEMPIENYNDDGAYQAKSNKEIQKERNIETNKKVSKMATEAAANYFGGPAAGKVVNAVNETKMGEKVHDAIAKKMHDASRRNILAHQTQKTLNNLNDVGAIDAANTALNIVNGDVSKGGMTAAAKNSATTNIANKKVTSSNVASASKNQKNNNFKVPKIDLKNSKILTSKDTKDNLFRKKIMKLIIKHPWLIGVILGIFLILLIVLCIIGSSSDDFSGGGNGSIAYDGSCSEMPIYGTTLSKSEYVEKVEAYFSPDSKWVKNDDNNKKWASKLYDNAGNMYDIATDNGVNPELVVARAVLEHGDSDYDTNNYWGIAVYNGASSGKSFSTFSEGVLAFVNLVKEYPNAFEMMMRYAYIGTYWAADDSKTGGNCSTSYGGCYYLPYMKDYYDNQDDYEKAASICNKEECKLKREGNYCFVTDASKCVKTRSTDSDVDKVDQIAYAKYQVARMAQQRKFIFGLDPVDCSAENNTEFGNFERCFKFDQFDPRWVNMKLGKSGSDMHVGCAVTSISIGISCFSNNFDPTFNPAKFLNLANSSQYVESCFWRNEKGEPTPNIYWSCPAIAVFAPNISIEDVSIDNVYGTKTMTLEQKVAYMQKYANGNYFILVHTTPLLDNGTFGTHFTLLKSWNLANGTFTVFDPNGGKISEYKLYDINAFKVYRY